MLVHLRRFAHDLVQLQAFFRCLTAGAHVSELASARASSTVDMVSRLEPE